MSGKYNLTELANEAMLERGFLVEFPPEVDQQVSRIQGAAIPPPGSPYRDMTSKLWVSIDNDDSKDLDQLTYAEKIDGNRSKIFVAIADVDSLVKKGSPIDQYASHNTTSVYTPSKIFSMLPLPLSTNMTSLNEKEKRCAVVIETEVTQDGHFDLIDIYPALVYNQAKLTYNNVGGWLDGKNQLPDFAEKIQGIDEQLRLQDRIAESIKEYRQSLGSLNFKMLEVHPIVIDEMTVGLQEVIVNRAHRLIENFMIASNVSMTQFLRKNKMPTIQRVVRTPQRWDRIMELAATKGTELPPVPDVKALQSFLDKEKAKYPENFPELSLAVIKLIGRGEYVAGFVGDPSVGHFDLAILDYSHTTAPNRRFPDLIMQRLLKRLFFPGSAFYNEEELADIAARCTQKEDDATKVERRMRKSAAALYLSNMIGKEFDSMVTGATDIGTWVRLKNPPVEGKLVRGAQGLDVGDRVRVKLVDVDVRKGFIDFIRV